jgi:hypothetical protein
MITFHFRKIILFHKSESAAYRFPTWKVRKAMMSAIGKDEARAALGAVVGAQRELATLACASRGAMRFRPVRSGSGGKPALPFAWRIGVFSW